MWRRILTSIVFVTATAVLGSIATVGSLLRPKSDVTVKLGKVWSRWILRAAGILPSYEGLEHARSSLPCVFISNHQSMVDIWVLLLAVPPSTRFVAKASLFRIPFLGWSIAAAGFIAIDRKNRARAMKSLAEAADRIRAGRSVLLFAEGTRSRDGRLAPFKRGAFHLAVAAGVPVVPVAISGSGRLLEPGFFRIRSGVVRVRFAPPIGIGPYLPDGVDRLSTDVRRAIIERLDPSEIDPAEALPRAGAR